VTTTVERQPRNGVDTPTLFATLDAVKGNPELAKFQFRATNRWVSGTHNRSTIRDFFGAGQEDTSRTADFTYDADHPAVLVGNGNGPTPVEFVLHALAACLTTTMVYHAAARGIEIGAVSSDLEGDIDVRGFMGLAPDVRKGYSAVRVKMSVESAAPAATLEALAKFSPVYDIVTNSLPVELSIEKR
jgi:uncharacterized OsmC-like protein